MSRDFLPDWTKEIEKNIPQTYDPLNWGFPHARYMKFQEVLHKFIYPDMNRLLDALNELYDEKRTREERHE